MPKVVTAANHKFNRLLPFWSKCVEDRSLVPVVYDLGGLIYRTKIPITVDVPGFDKFKKTGVYRTLKEGHWKSTAVHKPAVLATALVQFSEPLLYLDCDALLRLDPYEAFGKWDIGVTVRPPAEKTHAGRINAGVMTFASTSAARYFVEQWRIKTEAEGSDQLALNDLVPSIEPGQTVEVLGGVRVHGLPTQKFNNYYDRGVEDAVVVHLVGGQWKSLSGQYLRDRCRL